MVTRRVKQTAKKTPPWHTQAREEAQLIGVSEVKIKQQVEIEMIRIVAVKIADAELNRLKAERNAQPTDAPTRPLTDVERSVHKTGYYDPKEHR